MKAVRAVEATTDVDLVLARGGAGIAAGLPHGGDLRPLVGLRVEAFRGPEPG